MRRFQTRVVHDGIFWRVRLLHCGQWITLRNLHITRREAREDAKDKSRNGY